jgi:hypothetical protein
MLPLNQHDQLWECFGIFSVFLTTTRSKKHQTTSAKEFIQVVLNVFCVVNMLKVSTYFIIIHTSNKQSEENTENVKQWCTCIKCLLTSSSLDIHKSWVTWSVIKMFSQESILQHSSFAPWWLAGWCEFSWSALPASQIMAEHFSFIRAPWPSLGLFIPSHTESTQSAVILWNLITLAYWYLLFTIMTTNPKHNLIYCYTIKVLYLFYSIYWKAIKLQIIIVYFSS